MANTNITEAAQAIQQINVADMMLSMAMSLAEAQQKLDENSISTIEKLTETKIGDTSLLELGFHPAFYQFKFADLSASLNLNFKVHDYQTLGIEASVEYDRFKDFDKDSLKEIVKKQESAKRKEFTSSKDVVINVNRDNSLTVNESTVQIKDKEKTISKIRDLEIDLRANTDIERVESEIIQTNDIVSTSSDAIVVNSNGYITVFQEVENKEGIIEIKDIIGTKITIAPSKTFDVITDLDTTIGFANALLTGTGSNKDTLVISNQGYSEDGINFNPIELHFAFDKKYVDFSYSEGGVDNTEDELHFKILNYILSNSDARLKITGYTDAVGKTNYNNDLGKSRAEFTKGVLVSMGANADKITTFSKGETIVPSTDKGVTDTVLNAKHRKVLLELSTASLGFLYIKGDNISTITSADDSKCDPVWENDSNIPASIDIIYNDTTIYLKTSDGKLYNESGLITLNTSFNIEAEGDFYYLLHKDKNVKFTVYSNKKKDIEITENFSLDKDKRTQKDKMFVSESINQESLLKRATAKKDGSEYLSVNAKVDFRQTKQFDLDVQGNASINARLEAIPAPLRFTAFIDQITDKK